MFELQIFFVHLQSQVREPRGALPHGQGGQERQRAQSQQHLDRKCCLMLDVFSLLTTFFFHDDFRDKEPRWKWGARNLQLYDCEQYKLIRKAFICCHANAISNYSFWFHLKLLENNISCLDEVCFFTVSCLLLLFIRFWLSILDWETIRIKIM